MAPCQVDLEAIPAAPANAIVHASRFRSAVPGVVDSQGIARATAKSGQHLTVVEDIGDRHAFAIGVKPDAAREGPPSRTRLPARHQLPPSPGTEAAPCDIASRMIA